MNACPKCGSEVSIVELIPNKNYFACGSVGVGDTLLSQTVTCKKERATAAARHLMTVIAGACDDGKERWSRKELRRLYDHLKQQYPEFAP